MTTNTNLDSNPTSLTAPHPSLKNRVAIVTGGVRGLGRAMAFALLQAGALVVVTGVKDSPEFRAIVTDATAQVGPGRLIAVRADVTVSSDCQAVVQQALDTFGAVHVLVNNASLGMIGISQDFMDNTVKFWETDVADWQKIINTNVISTFLITKAVVPHLIAQGFGRIVNISTSLSTMVRAGFSPYGPSKASCKNNLNIFAGDLIQFGYTLSNLVMVCQRLRSLRRSRQNTSPFCHI